MSRKKIIKSDKSLSSIEKRAVENLPPKKHQGAKNCLVIDGMNIAYQAFYAYAKLSHGGKSTSILYGFINILRPIFTQYNPERVVVCWDGCKHPERVKAVPEYKSHRAIGRDKVARKKFLRQIKTLRILLYRLGISQAYDENIEGDDMVYWVTKRMQMLYRVIIVSCDKDFKQLINWDVDLFNPRSKHIMGVWAFTAENYGIEIHQYKDFLCLIGDKSDDIPGFPGIGETRAANFLGKHNSIQKYLDSDDDFPGLIDKEKVKKIYLRNNKMINLKYFNEKFNKGYKILWYKGKAQPSFKEDKYKEICLANGLKTCIFPKFLEPFKLLQNG